MNSTLSRRGGKEKIIELCEQKEAMRRQRSFLAFPLYKEWKCVCTLGAIKGPNGEKDWGSSEGEM